MSGLTVTCNQCERTFTAEAEQVATDDGGAVMQMVCPHCGQRYEIATIDATGVTLQQRIERLRQRGQTNTEQFNVLLSRYKRHVSGPAQ